MYYPDFSALWLSDVKDGRATALRDFPDATLLEHSEPAAFDALDASCCLGRKTRLGSWEGEDLTWTVVSVNRNEALLLCDNIVASQKLFKGDIDADAPGWWCESPSWTNTDIKAWLNLTFYSKAFNPVEQVSIRPAFGDSSPNPDMVVVLSAEEVEAYVPAEMRPCGETPWWLRNPSDMTKDAKPMYVDERGAICAGGTARAFRGIRPVITVRF